MLNLSADAFSAASSPSSSGTSRRLTTPRRPSTTGRLRQQPSRGWKQLTGRTSRLSRRMEAQMVAATEPMPKLVAPLAAMMSAARCAQRAAREARSMAGVVGRASERGMPPIVGDGPGDLWRR